MSYVRYMYLQSTSNDSGSDSVITTDGCAAHFGQWVWPLSIDYSLASNPSTQPQVQGFGQSGSNNNNNYCQFVFKGHNALEEEITGVGGEDCKRHLTDRVVSSSACVAHYQSVRNLATHYPTFVKLQPSNTPTVCNGWLKSMYTHGQMQETHFVRFANQFGLIRKS